MKDPYEGRVRVASAQYYIRPIDSFDQFCDQVTAVVETAAGYKARLLVLPEYFTIQLISLGDTKRHISEQVRDVTRYHGRYLELLAGLARANDLYIVGGTMPVLDDGQVYNDAHVFSPGGDVGVQGKLHMTRFEREEWDVQARDHVRIFETDFGRLGVAICYDVEFPELVRQMALEGVHLLAVPSNTDDRQGFLRVRYCAQARAIENQLYVVHAPTVGSLPRVPDVALNYGNAAILTPSDFTFARDGILAEGIYNHDEMIIGELDMRIIEDSRTFGTVLPLNDFAHTRQLTRDIDVVTL